MCMCMCMCTPTPLTHRHTHARLRTHPQIITLQDPSNAEHMALRDISNFKHLEEMRAEEAAKQAAATEKDKVGATIRTNASTEMVIKEFQRQKRVCPCLRPCIRSLRACLGGDGGVSPRLDCFV